MRAFVLHSGGVDSTTCLHHAINAYGDDCVTAINVDYGQRHGERELDYAHRTCEQLGVPWRVLHLANLIPATMLTTPSQALPNASYAQLTGVSPTYVPFRNGLLLSAATALAQGSLAEGEEGVIYFGAHAEDAANWAYPDCTPEFIGAMATAIYIGTYRAVRLATPLEWLTKAAIVRLGTELGVDWTLTWSCYAGGENRCGTCPTCRARRAAFQEAGVEDPTEYQLTPEAMQS